MQCDHRLSETSSWLFSDKLKISTYVQCGQREQFLDVKRFGVSRNK